MSAEQFKALIVVAPILLTVGAGYAARLIAHIRRRL